MGRLSALELILCEVQDERERQDAKWGGPAHDDRHAPIDWLNMIAYHNSKAVGGTFDVAQDYRSRLVKVAALAVAAIESYDRMFNQVEEDGE